MARDTLTVSTVVRSRPLSAASSLLPFLRSLLSAKDAAYNSSMPKAFLNWGLFDERFNYVSGGVNDFASAGENLKLGN
jgi:hypothetical protein